MASFHGDGPLEGWIARIVVNVARDEARRPPAPAMAPVNQPAADETPALAPMVAALPERQRLVLFLRYYADLPYDAIAKAVGVEVSTVGPTLPTPPPGRGHSSSPNGLPRGRAMSRAQPPRGSPTCQTR